MEGRENAASQTSHEEGLRYENAVFPILSFRAKARNLFRLRSGKGCEDSGEREAPCFQRIGRTVFHADSITKENGNGKRERSLGCARDDETGERMGSQGRLRCILDDGIPVSPAFPSRGRSVSSRRFTKAPYPPLTRSPFPNGEGLGGATLRVDFYKGDARKWWG